VKGEAIYRFDSRFPGSAAALLQKPTLAPLAVMQTYLFHIHQDLSHNPKNVDCIFDKPGMCT